MPFPSTILTSPIPNLRGPYLEARFNELREGYIAQQVFPVMTVATQSGAFGKIPLEEILKTPFDLERRPSTQYWRDTTKFTTDSYATKEYGSEEPIDDRESRIYMDYLDAYAVAADKAIHRILEAAEMRVAALVMNASDYSGGAVSSAAGTAWNSTGDPPTNIAAARAEFFTATGLYPNALIVNRKVFDAMKVNAKVTEKIASTGAGESIKPGVITARQVAEACNIDQVFVAGGAKQGSSAGTATHIWGDYAMLVRVATSNDLREPCIGRTFFWPGDSAEAGGVVEQYRDEAIRSQVVRVRHEVHEKRLHLEMGHLITGVYS